MPSLYDVSAEAQNDLFEIWRRIADDSVELANRIESEFYELFASLGRMSGRGHTRKGLIMAVLRGRRNVKRILQERL
jgi:plasmid stabilization system protein ParE